MVQFSIFIECIIVGHEGLEEFLEKTFQEIGSLEMFLTFYPESIDSLITAKYTVYSMID
jgi:hypothetical protein